MDPSEPQFLYMALILPSLFGLTLVGEGMHKVLNSRGVGWVSVIVGMGFIVVVVIAYTFLSGVI